MMKTKTVSKKLLVLMVIFFIFMSFFMVACKNIPDNNDGGNNDGTNNGDNDGDNDGDGTVQIKSFALLAPASGTVKLTGIPSFTWEDAEADSYTLYLSVHSDFTESTKKESIAGTNYIYDSALLGGTTYYWRVSAHKDDAVKMCNSVFSFTTLRNIPELIDDYDDYDTTGEMKSNFTVTTSGGAVGDAALDLNGINDGKSLIFTYSLGTTGSGAVRVLKRVEKQMQNFTGISFNVWQKHVSAVVNDVRIMLREEGGEEFEAAVSLKGSRPYKIFIPFTAFTPRTSGTLNLADVAAFSILFSGSGNDERVVLFDDIIMYNDESITAITEKGLQAGENFAVGSVFVDNMIVQRGKAFKVWGEADENTEVNISFNGESRPAPADAGRRFEAVFTAPAVSKTAKTIEFACGGETYTVNNVLVGDVYLASGQSNMQWAVKDTTDITDADFATFDNNMVRMFTQMQKRSGTEKLYTENGRWLSGTKTNSPYFSAVGFLTAIEIYKSLNEDVPVGIVMSAVGGTFIEEWMSASSFPGTINDNLQNKLYNGMLAPLKDYSYSGFIWYQGENNSGKSVAYESLLRDFVGDIRDKFNDASLPFFVVQLPSYEGAKEADGSFITNDYSFIRDYQAKAVKALTDTYMSVNIDTGNNTDIHPTAKKTVAKRIALLIEKFVYSHDISALSPTYKTHTISGNTVTVEFNDAAGLNTPANAACTAFEIAGSDGKFYPAAAAIIAGNKVELSSAKVASPVYFRYAFKRSALADVLMFNAAGLPLAPFRSYESLSGIVQYNFDAFSSAADFAGKVIPKTGSSINPVTASLEESDIFGNGQKSVKLEYDGTPGKNYGMATFPIRAPFITTNASNGFRFVFKGSNNSAQIRISLIENSLEEWQYNELFDTTTDVRTIELRFTDFILRSSGTPVVDGVLDLASIRDVVITFIGNVSNTIYIDSFCTLEKDFSPQPFEIGFISLKEDSSRIEWSKSLAADSYTLEIYELAQGLPDTKVHSIDTPVTTTYVEIQNLDFTFELDKTYKIYVTAAQDSSASTYAAEKEYTRPKDFIINDFEGYDDNDKLLADVTTATGTARHIRLAPGSGTMSAELDTSKTDSKSLKISYTNSGQNQVLFENFANPDSRFDTVSLWFDVPSDYAGMIAVRAYDSNGNTFEYYAPGTSTWVNLLSQRGKQICIPLSAFVKGSESIDPAKIVRFYFVINASASSAEKVAYIDNIMLVNSTASAPLDIELTGVNYSGWENEIITLSYKTTMIAADEYDIAINDGSTDVFTKSGVTSVSAVLNGFVPVTDKEYTIKITAENAFGSYTTSVKRVLKSGGVYLIEDFEQYADTTGLIANSSVALSGTSSEITMELAETSGKKLKVNTLGGNPNVLFNLNGKAADTYDVLEYNFSYDSTYSPEIFVRIEAMDTKIFVYNNKLTDGTVRLNVKNRTGTVRLALSSFYRTDSSATKLTSSMIKQIRFVFALATAKEFYFDDIKLVSYADGYSSEIINDFNSETDPLPVNNYALMRANMGDNAGNTVTAGLDAVKRGGNTVLWMSYGGDGGRLRYYPGGSTGSTAALAGKQTLSFATLSENANLSSISVLLVSTANRQYTASFPITNGVPSRIVVDLAGLAYVASSGDGSAVAINLSEIKEIRIIAANGLGSGTIYIDDISTF